ncbi:MAG: wax ester/triacylglycerol synthase family O-acyltransferase [Chloroflexi bacterium]|nr:MAG: wax ester/triacylglycerol synthase family O-acyltransferase [Chloroflexota bacterium]
MAEPLSNVDAAWLRMEDPTNLMMVTGILTFDEPLDFRRVRSTLEKRLLSFDRFRQRVVEAPLGLGPPRWVDDDRFDIDAHLHRVALPKPGDQRALEDLVSDLMSTPLDMSKPLWQIHVIDGYRGGSVFLSRLHHCIADGIALIQLLLSLTDETPRPRRVKPAARPERDGGFQLPFGALAQTLANPFGLLELAQTGVGVADTLQRLVLMPADPRTVLKGALGVSKRAAWSSVIPLEKVKAAGRRGDATVNDILVAAVTGALRSYLEERGEPVDTLEIRAAVPVNLRPSERGLELGNSFGLVFVPLPISVADRQRRVSEVKLRMDRIKASAEAIVSFGVLNAIGLVPRVLHPPAVEFFGSKASVVLTNVPGPKEALYLAGRRIAGCMFWVPQSGRMGLGVSILSYAGGVMVGIAADAGLVPDPERLVADFERELKGLMMRAERGSGDGKRKRAMPGAGRARARAGAAGGARPKGG